MRQQYENLTEAKQRKYDIACDKLSVKQNLYNFLIKYAMKQLEQGISKERIIKNIDNAIFNTTYSNVVVFEGGKAIESFEMIDLRNEIVEEIQNKNVKIK